MMDRPPGSENPSSDGALGVLRRAIGALRHAIDALRTATGRRESAASYAERPPGWTGHWSARYGAVLARTLELAPPITASQSETLAAIPRPLHEALDPVASLAEPTDRAGKAARWRLTRSALFDLLGPAGLTVGALVAAAVALKLVIALFGLPRLAAPPPLLQQQQQQQLQQQPQRPLQQQQQQQLPPSPRGPQAK
jgi:hypothetical protein